MLVANLLPCQLPALLIASSAVSIGLPLAAQGHANIVQRLLERGANPRIKDFPCEPQVRLLLAVCPRTPVPCPAQLSPA